MTNHIAPIDILDLVDIQEKLKYDNILEKAKGFTSLAYQILDRNLDQKKAVELRKVLFDCFYKYGDVPLELLLEFLPHLISKLYVLGGMLRQEVLEEFGLRVDKIDKIQRAFPAVLDACVPSFSVFLAAAAKIDPDVLTTMFVGEELQREHYRYILVLIWSGILDDKQKRRIGNMMTSELKTLFLKHHPDLYLMEERAKYDPEKYLRECPAGELESHPLDNVDFLQKLHLLHERPSVLRNPNIGRHIIYLPYMYLMCHYMPRVVQVIKEEKYIKQNNDVQNIFSQCIDKTTVIRPDYVKYPLTTERILSYFASSDATPEFFKFLEYAYDELDMFHKPHLLPGITALIPHCNDETLRQKYVNWIVKVLKESPEHSDSFFFFFIGMFARPFFPLCLYFLMDTLVELAMTQASVFAILKFFGMYIHRGEFRFKALECLGRLVAKYPGTVPTVSNGIFLTQGPNMDREFRSNIQLAKECCLATDNNDEILKKISDCLNNNTGDRLFSTMEAVVDLVKEDVLDLKEIRRQFKNLVDKPQNETCGAQYCRLLALGCIQQDEEPNDQFQTRKVDYIKEIYDFTKHNNSEIVSEAWRCLGDYQLPDIQEALNMNPIAFGEQFPKLKSDQRDGFIDFLTKLVEQEKESYQRPLYNVAGQTANVPALLSKIDSYKDLLNSKNKDEAWFWSATLPLSPSIIQLSAPSNKALNVTRILKSCLQHVPPADSQEEMLRLMAGWRICVREALIALTESKNNDILWARDQIVNEGRLSLTQKSESVDNIMMMLTVLVEAIEERLRGSDDPKQVDDVVISQKPWVISVFEFVATRLPKEIKEKREARANPIYQIMTQSNKSSLHIALFCARLLRTHPAIMEFYREEGNFGMAEDDMFTSLFSSIDHTLKDEEVPTRNMMWITAEAYGADELTAKAFEAKYRDVVDEKTEKHEAEPSLVDNDSIEKFFKELIVSSKSELEDIQQKNRKSLDKLWNNGTDEIKRKIYEGLADFALIAGSGRRKTVIPVEKLTDSSVLRGILQLYDEKQNVEADLLRSLTRALVNHKRFDGRYLPPIDWLKILNRAEFINAFDDIEAQNRLAIITLACEQNVPDVLFHFAKRLTPNELYTIAEHFPAVIKLVPRRQLTFILEQMAAQARIPEEEKENSFKLAKAITNYEKDPIVHVFLTQTLPKLHATVEVTDPILQALKEPTNFFSQISLSFDVWAEARLGVKMNMTRICHLISAEYDEVRQHSMFAILSMEARKLNSKQKIEKILDMITASRIVRTTKGPKGLIAFFPILLSLIVSINEDVDVPVCWFRCEHDNLIMMMKSALPPFYRALIKCPDMRKNAKYIGSFLRPYVDGDEITTYTTWQKTAATDMLCTLIAALGPDALDTLMEEEDFFWQTILPCA